nr:hypothetical protein [Bradyrhizobium cenepequi]
MIDRIGRHEIRLGRKRDLRGFFMIFRAIELSGFMRGQRHDACGPRPCDVDRRHEALRGVLLELGLARLFRLLERHCRPMRDPGGLKHDQFACGDPLAYFGYILFDRLRHRALDEPYAGKCVAIKHHDHGVQTDSLQSGGEQKCRVEAGGDRIVYDLAWPADLLSPRFEARRRFGVVNAEPCDRRIDRCGEHVCALRIVALIAVQRR